MNASLCVDTAIQKPHHTLHSQLSSSVSDFLRYTSSPSHLYPSCRPVCPLHHYGRSRSFGIDIAFVGVFQFQLDRRDASLPYPKAVLDGILHTSSFYIAALSSARIRQRLDGRLEQDSYCAQKHPTSTSTGFHVQDEETPSSSGHEYEARRCPNGSLRCGGT